MKKVEFLFSFVLLLLGFNLIAQDCKMFYPLEEGTEMEITSYDKKDKATGSSTQKVVEKEQKGDNVSLVVQSLTFDKKGEKVMEGEFNVSCEDGKFYMDMRNFLDPQSMAAYEDMEIEVDSKDMVYPSNLKVGDELPNASISVSMKSSGVNMFNMNILITNRKVEAREEITTPAGTFDCFKMSYDIETKMMVKVQAKAIQWIAEDVGMVKSESYSKNGKLEGYSLLTGFKK
jgi:hypothetical protein